MNFDLGRMRALMHALGDPQSRFPAVHVAGTNGKGSVSVMIAAALQCAGLRTALYTSPHLHRLHERFRVDGRMIPAAALDRHVVQIRHAVHSGLPTPTQFEALTAIAFLWFADQDIDFAVMEVGLGGRLDATNVLEHVAVSVITNIGLDHTAWLGKTLKKIAAEKAGILRLRTPLVTAAEGEARGVIVNSARALGAPVNIVSRPYPGPVGLDGPHQRMNAAVAAEALRSLRRQGSRISESNIRSGISEAEWPGRFERFTLTAGQNRISVVLDGAHNAPAALALAATLRKQRLSGLTVFFGALRDKDVAAIARTVAPFARRVLTVTAPSDRAVPAGTLATLAPWKDRAEAVSLRNGFWRALQVTGNGTVLVTGSLYVVGAVRQQLLGNRI